MRVGRHRLLILGLTVALLVGQWGCALKPYRAPSEEIRAQFGTVGVISRRLVPEAALEGPTGGKGAGAAKGAGLGAGYSLLYGVGGGAYSGNPLGFAIGVALGVGLAPVAALVGGIYGAVTAEPASKVQEAERALKNAFAELNVSEAIQDLVPQVATAETGHRFVSLAEHPAASPEPVDYRSPASEGVDTILEVSVPVLGLVGPVGVNPPLQLVVQACARLIRTADGTTLYTLPPVATHPLAYASPGRKFVEWGAEDARLFREELDRAYQTLAEKIVEELFLFHPGPGRRWRAPAVGGQPARCPTTVERVAS